MNTYLRIIWLITLTIFTSGCSGFQTACYTWARANSVAEDTPWEDCDLRPGDKVRITTLEGNRVVGRLDRISPDWIVIQPETTSSLPRLFSPSQIQAIEKSTAPSSGPVEMDKPEIGEVVSLYLVDGSRVEGEVVVFNDQEIVLDHRGQSSQPRGYPTDQVQWLTVKKGGGSSWVAPVVGILVIGAVVGGIYINKVRQSFSEPINIFGD